MMKEALLRGELSRIGDLLEYGWKFKKEMAAGISNPVIDNIYDEARKVGATGGKISGAGGGGFMTFFCPGNTRYCVSDKLREMGGEVYPIKFSKSGLTTWTIK